MDQEIRRAEELEKKTRAEGWEKKRRRGVKEGESEGERGRTIESEMETERERESEREKWIKRREIEMGRDRVWRGRCRERMERRKKREVEGG